MGICPGLMADHKKEFPDFYPVLDKGQRETTSQAW